MQTGSGDQAARRPHTGRRRNEAARRAILDVVVDLIGRDDDAPVTIDTIAAAAGVGKQTIYRWWPSKGAVLLEAMTERADLDIPPPDTGTLAGDLETFLRATFHLAGQATMARLLRKVMVEAQLDPQMGEATRSFLARRRSALRGLFERAAERGETASGTDPDLLVDQAFGVLWYRILVGHAPLTEASATELAGALTAQAVRRAPGEPG
ncbi:TetR/AcrR family transcriptional regulator [Streptosporangium sandarakinum]|uniref:AcrR family transcriptional regulator n=1 Tax=Streptosporangium sandarakinum TaxID=1260955 RepID=A0A852V711_9ACTN|nr:TetR/AcrR family transcriptional regulator [Streptosporangium sandarakinum]NYF43073.1 AcrR family transcriptional regulator [Streptosporangium sandarakinum]